MPAARLFAQAGDSRQALGLLQSPLALFPSHRPAPVSDLRPLGYRGGGPSARGAGIRTAALCCFLRRPLASTRILLRTLIVLGVPKMCATTVSCASGKPGGIFGPSLYVGAMAGRAVGMTVQLARFPPAILEPTPWLKWSCCSWVSSARPRSGPS